ncbi:hypothetical protein BgiMline_033212, partial [Biomphalaria glabrata]
YNFVRLKFSGIRDLKFLCKRFPENFQNQINRTVVIGHCGGLHTLRRPRLSCDRPRDASSAGRQQIPTENVHIS